MYVINQLQKSKGINVGIAVISELVENQRNLNVYNYVSMNVRAANVGERLDDFKRSVAA